MPDVHTDFSQNEFLLDAVFYRLQTTIDALMDIFAMMCRDTGIPPTDDYSNIEALVRGGLFPGLNGSELKRINGLRNVPVHQYNGIDTDLVLENVEEVRKIIISSLRVVENATSGRN